MKPIPVLVVGDSPTTPTGLGRICRDLMTRLWQEREALGITLGGLFINWNGMPQPWPIWPVRNFAEWGEKDLPYAWNWHSRGDRGVIFTIWDPARCYALTASPLPSGSHRRWGYFAVDAENVKGGVGGPAGEAVAKYDRILAYGRYGAGVLKRTTGNPVTYLPHGIETAVWQAPAPPIGSPILVGAVATNQPRKNLGLLFQTWGMLKEWDPTLKFWLHTDLEITEHWSIPQLASDFGLGEALLVTGTTGVWEDDALKNLYQGCLCTIAPSVGEGFGYPIVESLASGVPVIHWDGAGGAELIPKMGWRAAEVASYVTGALDSIRPVLHPLGFADAAKRAITWKREEPEVAAAYCRGSVAHLDWGLIWPKWRRWFTEGLEAIRA